MGCFDYDGVEMRFVTARVPFSESLTWKLRGVKMNFE